MNFIDFFFFFFYQEMAIECSGHTPEHLGTIPSIHFSRLVVNNRPLWIYTTTVTISVALYSRHGAEEISGIALINNVAPLLLLKWGVASTV